jgi:branched-chain amino acid transport system ATP-binding protein
MLLKCIGITKYFGGLPALRDVSLEIDEGEIVGLIGPNGAGKTTLFNVISGFYRPTSGKVIYMGKDITNLKPYQICRLGIVRTFQIVRPFLSMTAIKHVMCGALFGRSKQISMNDAHDEALQCLEYLGLLGKKDMPVKNLTLVERKMVELATALNTEPKLLLLDEIIAGLNPAETIRMMETINKIREEFRITVFWVEHVMKAIMNVAERIVVLHHGEKIAEGTPQDISKDEMVITAYLGRKRLF